MRAPDFDVESERAPAVPARSATRIEYSSGWEMNSVAGRASSVRSSGAEPNPRRAQREQKRRADSGREPDCERFQRASRELPLPLDERDAETGERPELRADDHRSDDENDRVLDDPDRGDHRREKHEADEAKRELRALGGLRLDRFPDDRVGRRADGDLLRAPCQHRTRAPRSARVRWSLACSSPSSRSSATTTLASSRATSQRNRSPPGRSATSRIRTTLIAEGCSSSARWVAYASSGGATTRR